MTHSRNRILAITAIIGILLIGTGFLQSWNLVFALINLCLVSAIMTMGVNIQWGYAGLVNLGMMGFAALGGLAVVVTSVPPVHDAIAAGGAGILVALIIGSIGAIAGALCWYFLRGSRRIWVTAIVALGFAIGFRAVFDPAVAAIEAVNPASTGYLGGFGAPVLLSWIIGAILAAGAAWMIGRVTLGLRSDYLAIATLGISEITVYVLRNEDWLARGVKNVVGLPRPVPYEIALQESPRFIAWANWFGADIAAASSLAVKLFYMGIFTATLAVIYILAEIALRSPWGRMMRAIRDNETAAMAMGKNVQARHLQVFVIGSALVGLAGAMLVTLDGQFTPTTYQPLRFTFLIWVMVIVGGSGNNTGAIIGSFIIWFFWIQSEPLGLYLIELLTSPLAEDSPLRLHLIDNAQHMRLLTMGLVLLLALRFAPMGLIPEEKR